MLKNLFASTKYIALMLAIAMLGAACSGGCAGAQERAGRVVAGTVDCLSPDAADAIGAFAPAIANVVRNATAPDGTVDWSPIKDIGRSLKSPAARCVMASVIAEAMRPSKPRPDAPQSSALQWDPASLSSGWEELRGEWGGHKYQLASGTL